MNAVIYYYKSNYIFSLKIRDRNFWDIKFNFKKTELIMAKTYTQVTND